MKKECYIEAGNLISSNLEEAKNYLLPLIARYDPDAVALYARVLELEGDIEKAIVFYNKSIDRGGNYAKFFLAERLMNSGNIEEANQLYEEVYKFVVSRSEEHNPAYQYALGFMNFYGIGCGRVNRDEAVKCYLASAKQDFADSQNALGDCYSNGDGVLQNLENAVQWYERAAEHGH